MHAKFDEFGVLARLFVPDIAGPRALPIASPAMADRYDGPARDASAAVGLVDGGEVRHDRQD